MSGSSSSNKGSTPTNRFITFLPEFNQTTELSNFFGTTIDELFQGGLSNKISGYIGEVPTYSNPITDFYIQEPTPSRQAYSLEAGMISTNTSGTVTNALTYPDFVTHLSVDGANTTNQQRMFETDYYSWAPPINIDMITNYREYYWFGDATGSADLPTLILTVPFTSYTGDGSTTTFALPVSINAVPTADETPTVFVNNVPVAATKSGNNMICSVAPANGTSVILYRVPDLTLAITGDVTVNVADINTEGVTALTSTMRVQIIDSLIVNGAWDIQPWDYAPWDDGGNGLYMVDGIGLGVRLTPDSYIIRDTTLPQYVTIDRSSVYPNQWSYHNSWVHVDSFAWSGMRFPTRQANRNIIEFIRDIVLYPNQTWEESTDPLFMLYDIEGFAYNDPVHYPASTFQGNRIFGYTLGTFFDSELNRLLSFDNNDYPIFSNDGYVIPYTYTTTSGTFVITSLDCYGTTSIVDANFVGSISGTTLTVTSVNSGTLAIGQLIICNNIPISVTIIALGTGTGGTGTYILNNSAEIASTDLLALSLQTSAEWHLAALPTVQNIDANLFYEIPLNLQANPSSLDVKTISESTWVNHFQSLIYNQANFTGQPLGDNNYRDSLRDLSVGQYILQHRAPLLKSMLISSDNNLDLPSAIRYADQEYNKFRNRFIRKLVVINNSGLLQNVNPVTNPQTWVTTALFEMNRNQNASFPFALSTMGGGQYFIPPTAPYLGVLPAVVPGFIYDDTIYNQVPNTTPTELLQGHDGSLTPLFGDYRDNILLALEQMIYDNLSTQFKTEARPVFDIASWIGDQWSVPVNGYTFFEFTDILGPMFEIWVQNNGLNYSLNPNYDSSDPFTWNFNGVLDIFGNSLPGNWRAIYRFYYGTDAPHTRPWEMLGFTYQPTWWVGQYGSAPYLKTNTALWTDLQNGTIRGGPRIGTDTFYARPGLANLIPVNNAGQLLNPVQVGIVTTYIPISVSSRSWQPGDQGPVENIWINSTSYRYAVALAAFLMKTARFTEECWDSVNIGYVNTQWVNENSNLPFYLARPLNSEQYVHGETNPEGTLIITIGIQQWIADYLVSSGLTSTVLGNAVRGLDVRLLHQMAGFVSNNEIQLLADNFGLIPSEDVNVFLYTSPATDVEVYSGVILQWTGTGWRVLGYDAQNPSFTIIPPDTSSAKGIISLATTSEPAINPWNPNTYYAVGLLVVYLNSVYQCNTSHMSSQTFESAYWTTRSDLVANPVLAPRVITYASGLNMTQSIPYGTEFTNYQAIANFLLGWERYLISRGWSFNTLSTNGQILNWSLSVEEFLTWAQIQWQPGNFIALSPGLQGLQFSTATGTILNVEDNITGFFGLLDRSGNPIRQNSAQINRLDGQISLSATNADIFCARLEIVEIEHLLIVDNVTIFGDDVYLPLFNMRQLRLKLICNRAPNWAGRLDAPGFMVIGNTMQSNFQKSANDVRYMFDIELADNEELRDYARHNVAFQQRAYLNNLLINEIEQFEFYQGMIQQKGAPGVFEKLMRSTIASSNSNIQFLEEWAFLISEYGAPVDPYITFQVSQTDTRTDPQIVRFLTTPNAPPIWIQLPLVNSITGNITSTTLVPGNTFVLNGVTVTVLTAPYGIPNIVTDINNLNIVNIVASVAGNGALTITNIQGESITLGSGSAGLGFLVDDGIGIPLQMLGLSIGTYYLEQWIDKPETANFFTTYETPKYLLPTAGHVRISDVTNIAFNISDVPAIYPVQFAAGIIPFPTNSLTWVYEREDGTYTVLQSFDTGTVPNAILEVITHAEDMSITDTRLVMQNSINLLSTDVGNYVVIDGQSDSNPELQGLQVISSVDVGNYFDLTIVGISGNSFSADPSSAPIVRILREVRFATLSDLTSAGYNWAVGNIAWVDNYSDGQWAVLQWNGSAWIVIRNQPSQLNTKNISETVLYHENVQIVGQQIFISEPIVPTLDVIDPLSGLIVGVSEVEIDYKTPYDPARYNSGNSSSNNAWGDKQIGRVWWNLATVKFLEPYTDTIGITNARDIAELSYRSSSWTQIAPNSFVDVYEWTKSTTSPQNFTGPGTLLTDSSGNFIGNWVEIIEYNPLLQQLQTNYYYWVKGLTVIPNVSFRQTPVATVAAGIVSPSSLNVSWLAPINTDALIFSGVIPYLNDVDTVLKVRLTLDPVNPGRHNEWQLLRPTDETTLPSDLLWYKLRDSLAAFNETLNVIPYTSLAPTRNTGVGYKQNMFSIDPNSDGSRSGLMDARQAFVGSINNIFAATAVAINSQTFLETIYRSQPIYPYLMWTQIDKSYPWEQPPANEWQVEVYSILERNKLVAREDFVAAVENQTTIDVLVNGIGNSIPYQAWSIWTFNPAIASLIIAEFPSLPPSVALLQNISQVFTLKPSYEYSVSSMVARNALVSPAVTINVGDRVLVTTDASTFGFWSIWRYEPNTQGADAFGFILWRVQAYRTNDFITLTDWYAPGYSVDNPPIVAFDTILDRDNNISTSFSNTFVKVNDNGSGSWIWTVLIEVIGPSGPIAIPEVIYPTPPAGITTVWQTVAIQNGTVELSSEFYNPTNPVHDVTTISINDIENRDGSWELYILVQAMRYDGLLTDSNVNQNWFDMVNFIFTQQTNVYWAFKTSFMNIVGYSVPLVQTPYVIPDQTQNLIDYVDEIKPYRVKIREFATQYVLDIDDADTVATDFDNPVYFDPALNQYRVLNLATDTAIFETVPWVYWYDNYLTNPNLIRGLNIDISFDRYAIELYAWDEESWDSDSWDNNSETIISDTYVHTEVITTLITASPTIHVDNVLFLNPTFITFPITMNIGENTYLIGSMAQDIVNVSTTIHGVSGTITTVSGNILVSDGTSGNLVEAILPTPSAADRIIQYYDPTDIMPPNNQTLLMNLDLPSTTITYATTVDAPSGSTILTFTSTIAVYEDQGLAANNIIQGTIVTAVTSTTVTLSQATIGDIPAGSFIVFNLPDWIDGGQLSELNNPSDFDTEGFDTEGLDTVVANFDNLVFDGGEFYINTFAATTGATSLVLNGIPSLYLETGFENPDDTLLQNYSNVGDLGATFDLISGSNAFIEADAVIGNGNSLYSIGGISTVPDYTLIFNVKPTNYSLISSNGSTMYVIGRANGSNDGYQAIVTSNGSEYFIGLTVMNTVTSIQVAMGTLTSGVYNITLSMQADFISIAVQRTQDNNWLNSSGTWISDYTLAINITDLTYQTAGINLLGGNWIT